MSQSRRQLGAVTGALVFAFLALVSGFDRMSEQRPSFGRFVPSMIASHSWSRTAADTLAQGDFGLARLAATEAVGRDPLDSRGVAFLGVALQQGGEVLPAHNSFLQATRLSKREPLSQIYFFQQELAIGSYARAASRLDMFLRSVNGREMAQTLLAMFEEQAGNTTHLAEKLSSNPRWAEAYLRAPGIDSERLRKRAAFLAVETPSLDGIGCAAVMPMMRELLRRNFRKDADGLARRHCGAAVASGPIADADFARFGDEDAPLGWRRYSSGDVRVSRLGGEEPRIEIENRSSVTRLFLSQPVALAPGTYLLRAKVDGPGGQDLVASLNCTSPSRPRVGRERLDREGQRLAATGCPDAVLSLWLRPGSGRVVIDRVDMERVSP